jgi:hypothetical protein
MAEGDEREAIDAAHALLAGGDDREAFASVRARLAWPRGRALGDAELPAWIAMLGTLATRRGAERSASSRRPWSAIRTARIGSTISATR